MKNDEVLTAKMEKGIVALLTTKNLSEAAEVASVSINTLLRWQQNETFNRRYREAKREAFSIATATLQQAVGEAAHVLRSVALDAENNPSARVAAAKAIIDMALKAREQEDLSVRLEELEKMVSEL